MSDATVRFLKCERDEMSFDLGLTEFVDMVSENHDDFHAAIQHMQKKLWPKGTRMKDKENQVCPECGHVFQGNGWDGIDAHWRAKHEDVMPYEKAWPELQAGTYQNEGDD